MSNELAKYIRQDNIIERFSEALGERRARAYITSVALAVANSDYLQRCTPQSIVGAALRAATLGLSCDPSTKQAYLVPFKNKATLIVGYKGLYDMAIRTGKYRYINVDKLYEGERVEFDRFSGAPRLEGKRTGDVVIGYSGSFEMFSGYSKTIYMSVEEIHEHKEKYSKGYNRADSAWNTAKKTMEKKTVLRNLLMNWGYMDPSDVQALEMAEDSEIDQDLPDLSEADPVEEESKQSADEIIGDLGFDVASTNDKDFTIMFKDKVTEIGMDWDTANAILKESGGDIEAAYNSLLENHVPPTKEQQAELITE
jgi:recombination protein RecT